MPPRPRCIFEKIGLLFCCSCAAGLGAASRPSHPSVKARREPRTVSAQTGTVGGGRLSSCDSARRVIGAFGALDRPNAAVVVPARVKAQLPKGSIVRKVMNTRLAPGGEELIFYDVRRDELEPLPRLAVLVGGSVLRTLDSFSGYGFTHYLSSCEFTLNPGKEAVALAYSTAGDGSGTDFQVLGWDSGGYRKLLGVNVAQGRMLLQPDRLSVWASLGTGECVWCRSRYTETVYVWSGERFVSQGTRMLPGLLDPGEVSGLPLVILKSSTKE